jgi:hypothetical protein
MSRALEWAKQLAILFMGHSDVSKLVGRAK